MSTDEPGDAELLTQVAAQDEAALQTLFGRHAPWLSLRLRRRSSDDDVVLEALQETFLSVWRSAGRYRGDGDVAAWLWGIAIRQLITATRRRRTLPVLAAAKAALVPDQLSAEEELLLAVEHGDVGTALRSLSPELRGALQATVIDGLTTREAAQLLGIPTGTVKSRVRLAKARLRKELTEGWT